MLTRFRRSAGLLLALLVAHLTMAISGAVCTTPGMTAMNGSSVTQAASMDPMADMATSERSPCSTPAQGSCVASTPCVTAFGASKADELAMSSESSASDVLALTVTMPATSGSAPDLPPPRA